jgi:CDP-6-deoxy-D-xylo-4-hexulose-3-dehydrase
LKKLDEFVRLRRRNFDELMRRLKAAGLEEFFHLPVATPNSNPSWFGFLLTIRDGIPLSRSKLTSLLEDRKVGTRLLFGGNLIKQPAFKDVDYRVSGSLENTDKIMHDSFWIGVWPGIDEPRLDYMVATLEQTVKELLGQHA